MYERVRGCYTCECGLGNVFFVSLFCLSVLVCGIPGTGCVPVVHLDPTTIIMVVGLRCTIGACLHHRIEDLPNG